MSQVEGMLTAGPAMGNMRVWSGTATTTGGVATFTPTDGAGNAIFATIQSVHVNADTNTTVVTSVPIAAVKLISADRKTITVNAVIGTVLGVLGATVLVAPDGTKVHCLVIGT